MTPDSSSSPSQAASMETLRQLVAAGNGCALIPEMAVARGMDCAGLVRYISFRDPSPGRTIGLVFHQRCLRVEDAAELGSFLTKLHRGSPGGRRLES